MSNVNLDRWHPVVVENDLDLLRELLDRKVELPKLAEAPVIEIDGRPVGDGSVGDVRLATQTLYSAHMFDF